MNAACPIAAIAVASAALLTTGARAAAAPSQCTDYSALGFCVEWSSAGGADAGFGGGSRGGGGGDGPPCYWTSLDGDIGASDPNIFVDYGLPAPPAGVRVVWQSWECADGTFPDNYRWILAPQPADLAAAARARIARRLPQPEVASSPAPGVPAIVGVPVFIAVTNWTGTVTEQECAAGLCVTVQARPALTFSPGEPEAPARACAGAGSHYDPAGAAPEAQAADVGACAHSYALRTGIPGRPAAWSGSVSVTWTITWSASSGATGSLSSVTRSTDVPRAVEEVQAVVMGGETP